MSWEEDQLRRQVEERRQIATKGVTRTQPREPADHFDSLGQQYDAAKLGMWFFLITEVLFFGGLFCAYGVYRANRPEVFVDGHHFLSTPMGTFNTVLLIASSLTMALAVRRAQRGCAQRGQRVALVGLLIATLACAVGFLGIKGIEYRQKWNHGLVPGQARIAYWIGKKVKNDGSARQPTQAPQKRFAPDQRYVRAHLAKVGGKRLSEEALSGRIDNLRSFMGIYFGLTALHALHVAIGIGVISWILIGALRGRFDAEHFTPVDLVGLYWHLVDMIWIYLFPLLYLIH